MPVSLEEVRIQGLPPSAFYIADFISIEEEQSLLDKVSFVRGNLGSALIPQRSHRLQSLDGSNFREDVYKLGPPV